MLCRPAVSPCVHHSSLLPARSTASGLPATPSSSPGSLLGGERVTRAEGGGCEAAYIIVSTEEGFEQSRRACHG